MPKFCPNCGNQLQFENAEICMACGKRVQALPPVPEKIRNPFLAILFSFLFIGWGQWYNGKTGDGLKFVGVFLISYFLMVIFTLMMGTNPLFLIIALIFWVVLFGTWIYGMYDAYTTADRINSRRESFSGKSRLFWLPMVLILLIGVLIFAAVVAAFVFGMAGNISATKVVSASTQRIGGTIHVTFEGGVDADSVTRFSATVTDNSGVSQTKYLEQPEYRDQISFTGSTSGKDHVMAIAAFTDRTDQVILDTYV
jgi:hypothetical protein